MPSSRARGRETEITGTERGRAERARARASYVGESSRDATAGRRRGAGSDTANRRTATDNAEPPNVRPSSGPVHALALANIIISPRQRVLRQRSRKPNTANTAKAQPRGTRSTAKLLRPRWIYVSPPRHRRIGLHDTPWFHVLKFRTVAITGWSIDQFFIYFIFLFFDLTQRDFVGSNIYSFYWVF